MAAAASSLSLATLAKSAKKPPPPPPPPPINNGHKLDSIKNGGGGGLNENDSRYRKHVTEEINDDSIYNVYLKKITYTFNNTLRVNNSNFVTRCDQVDYRPKETSKDLPRNNSKWYDDQQVGLTRESRF